MNAPIYTTAILRLASSLHAPRALRRVDGRAALRSPTCGATITTQVSLDGGKVVGISQTVQACAFGQASAALLESGAPGKSALEVQRALDEFSDWLADRRDDPGDWPGLAALAPARPKAGRHGAMLLPFRALVAAMASQG